MIPQFHGRIEGDKFKLSRKEVWWAYCKGLKDGKYYLELHKSKGPPKTLEQLAYYYAVIIPTAYKQMVEDGNDSIIVKIGGGFIEVPLTEEVVDRLLKEQCAKFDGEKVINKADMTIEQASEFIDKCIRWCAEKLHCVIPEPI